MPARLALLPLLPLYSLAVRLRAAAYRRGVISTHRLPVPVVSVGNVAFGGTGKTPTVIALARDLVRRGRRPAVLTRGYGRSDRAPRLLVGPDPQITAAEAGDEPLELAMRLPGVPVVVDPDRVRGASAALRRGADVVLLDDGFQHLRVERDLDLVLLDAGDPWAGGALPPLGRLREPLGALARADAILVTKMARCARSVPEPIRRRLAELAPGTPVLGSTTVPRRVATPEGSLEPSALRGRRVFAFAGLARPSGFVGVLEGAGAEVVGHRWFADHHPYREQDLGDLLARSARLGAVPVTTAKDRVKLPPSAPVWVVEVEVEPLAGSWDLLWRVAGLGPA